MTRNRSVWIAAVLVLVSTSPAFALWGEANTPPKSNTTTIKIGTQPIKQDPTQVKPATTLAYKEYLKYLVIIAGDKSRGSGFIALYRGKASLFTNTHVLSGNSRISASLLNGKNIALQGISLADPYDLSIFSQATVNEGLEILMDTESNISIGDAVVVVGNSLGAGVVTELTGNVTGIGPELIEVDAKFVSGNSGSPIIHVKTGKVIGIATFSVIRVLEGFGNDSKFNSIERRFAYRLDNIPAWQNMSWQGFSRESAILNNVITKTDDIWALALDIYNNGSISAWDQHLRAGNCVAPLASTWQKTLVKYGKADITYRDWYTGEKTTVKQEQTKQFHVEKERFLASVIALINSDVALLRPGNFTGYHKTIFQEQLRYRESLKGYFSPMRQQLSNDPKFITR